VRGLAHDVLDLLAPLRAQDAIEIDGAEQLEGGIDDEDLREALRQVLVFAHVVDALADRPEWRHGDEFRLHAATGRAFRIVERTPQPHPLGEWQLGENFFPVFLVEVFENVDRVVRIELTDRRCDRVVRDLLDDFETNGLVDFGQGRKVEIVAEQLDRKSVV
jgi:hypothetical protein